VDELYIDPSLKRLSLLPPELLQIIAQMLMNEGKHRACSRFNRTCRVIRETTMGIFWKTATIRARSIVEEMVDGEKWKDFISGDGFKHCK
jgi:hypothetical protein